MGGFLRGAKEHLYGNAEGITGKTGAEASLKGAQLQYDATLKGIEAQEESEQRQLQNLAQFRNLTDKGILDRYKEMAMGVQDYTYDPAQDSLLQNAANFTSNKLLNIQAAQGKAGSGGTQLAINEALAPIFMQRQNQLFAQRFDANNQRFNWMNQLVSNSQNAAAGQGAAIAGAGNNISDLYGQGGNALAAGGIGAANAYSQGASNVAGIAGAIIGAVSDEREKEDMIPIGKDENGLNIYLFKYKKDVPDNPIFRGYSAQEVAEVDPDHVGVTRKGVLMVSPKYAPQRVS